MHRVDTPGNVNALFFDGNPALGQDATQLSQHWLNDVQENLCTVIEDAGIALAKGDSGQLLAALNILTGRFLSIDGAGKSFTLGGVLTVKTGVYAANLVGELSVDIIFAVPFGFACWTVLITPRIDVPSVERDAWVQIVGPSISQSGFTAQKQLNSGPNNDLQGFTWLAIGVESAV